MVVSADAAATSGSQYTTIPVSSATPNPPQVPAKLAVWANILRAAAEATFRELAASPLPGTFRDEHGHSRPVDAYLVAVCGLGPPPLPASPTSRIPPETHVWAALFDDGISIEQLVSDDPAGPLLKHPAGTALETLTEADLCAIHGLWSLAARRRRLDLAARCLAAAEWHLSELQPDNATNTPWAVHIMAILGLVRAIPLADFDAQTRLNNAIVAGGGTPDRRSAMILHHAAHEIDRLAADPFTVQALR